MASTPSEEQMDACLGIPMPTCLRDFVAQSFESPRRHSGTYTDSLITNYGDAHGKAMEEVEKCRFLADGPDDIVVLLERPATDHKYSVPLAEFVSCSNTLRAVDELIRFATRSQRNIQNVSAVDVFSLKPRGATVPSDEECHDLATDILQAKRPKVIIGCTGDIRASHWLYCLNAGKVTGVPCTKYVDLGVNGHSALFVASFHPGYCINWVNWLNERPSRGDALIDLLFNLWRIHQNSSRDTIVLEARKEGLFYAVVVEEIFDLLWTLQAVSATNKALLISKALRTWQLFFPRDSLQNRFTAQLVGLGHRQDYFTDGQQILTGGMKELRFRPLKLETRTTLSGVQWEEEVPALENVRKACLALRCSAKSISRAVLLFTKAQPQDPDFFDISQNLVETLSKSWTSLQEFVALVSALPAVLEGGRGLFPQEDDFGEQSILRRGDARTRVQGLFEHLMPTAADMLKRIKAMKKLARKGLPISVLESSEEYVSTIDELNELIELIRKDVGVAENELRQSFWVIVALRISLAAVRGLLEEESSPPLGPLALRLDRGMKEIYQQDILPAARLKRSFSRA